MTLFIAIYKKFPFVPSNNQNFPELFNLIANEKIIYPDKPKISENLKDFLEKILCKDPNNRIKIEDIKNHIWLNED